MKTQLGENKEAPNSKHYQASNFQLKNTLDIGDEYEKKRTFSKNTGDNEQ